MSGILCAVAGMGGGGTLVTVGSFVFVSKVTIYYYGYDGAIGGSTSTFGSITNDLFNGATIKAVYSSNPTTAGQATSYGVVFNGNRAAGFFNSLSVDGTLVTGTLGSPNYNATNDETTFTITLASSAATLFGTVDGVIKPVVLG